MKRILLLSMLIMMGAFLFSCTVEEQTISKDMSQQLALLPDDANMVGYMNFNKIKDSEFFQMFMDSTKGHPFKDQEYLDFVAESGLDLQKDIHEIYLAARMDTDDPVRNGLIIVKGNFDPQKIMDYVRKKSETKEYAEESYQDWKLYTMDMEKKAFCFADNSTFVAGEMMSVKDWLNRSTKKASQLSETMLDRIANLRYKNSAWFTMDADPIIKNLRQEQMQKMNGIESLKNISASMDLTEEFKFYGESQFTSREKAELFRDAIKGLIATGKLSMSEDREVIDILNSIDVDAENDRVEIDFKFTKEEIQKLMERKDSFDPKII